MSSVDLRQAINVISEVVVNRPPSIRETDQIYMKLADMYLQADHVSSYMDKKKIIFIGDGDAVSLSLVHLHKMGILNEGPSLIKVLDFDERVINSINRFAENKGYADHIQAILYNVADPLPKSMWQRFDVFYSNPPFGSSNNGVSVEIFLRRGIEAIGDNATGCIVIADFKNLKWTQEVLYNTQKILIDKGFYITEMIPQFHSYHLDDAPELTSCSLIVKRFQFKREEYASQHIQKKERNNFYGQDSPLIWKYIKDKRNGDKLSSHDYEFIGFEEEEK